MIEIPETLKQLAAHDVGAEKIARVYAEALLEQALKQGKEQEIHDELRSLIVDVLLPHPEVEDFLVSGALGRDEKARLIATTFGGRASDLLVNFLQVLNEHDRLDLIRPCAALFGALLEGQRGQMRVQVRSAVALTAEEEERLLNELRQTMRIDPVLEKAVDPELLGGLVVRVGDWLYDASVRTRLETLRNQIIENSSHEIQTGRNRFSYQ